jgi:dTDP-4-dehydrorhamnose reductase
MLGHKLVQTLRRDFDVWTTVRGAASGYAHYEFFDLDKVVPGVDVLNFDTVVNSVAMVHPQVVVNCVGIIKQLAAANDPIVSLTVNSLFSHRMHRLCRACGARLIHFSTDCVFSGRKGMYTEADVSDASDMYGRTKFLGETSGAGAVTLRTSIIGRELRTAGGLVEWFLAQRGRVEGYTRAIYSGFTTLAMARIVRSVLIGPPELSGTIQVSSEPINKYDLLMLIRRAFNVNVDIVPTNHVQVDRSLDSTRFRDTFKFTPPSWPAMIDEMAADPTPYDVWRQRRDSDS